MSRHSVSNDWNGMRIPVGMRNTCGACKSTNATHVRRNYSDHIRSNDTGQSTDCGGNAHQNAGIVRAQIERIYGGAGHALEHNRYGEIDDDREFVALRVRGQHDEGAGYHGG